MRENNPNQLTELFTEEWWNTPNSLVDDQKPIDAYHRSKEQKEKIKAYIKNIININQNNA